MGLISLASIWYFICHYLKRQGLGEHAEMMRIETRRDGRMICAMLCLLGGFSLSSGCSRSTSWQNAQASPPTEDRLPFHEDAENPPDSGTAQPELKADPQATGGLPFYDNSNRLILQPGTLLTVQLEDALSSSRVRAGDRFRASLASPLPLRGDRPIGKGVEVSGHVEAVGFPAEHRRLEARSGYFELALTSMTVADRQIPLQTSSLFAKGRVEAVPSGSVAGRRTDAIRVEKGRRLTFRLTAPMMIEAPDSKAANQ